MSADMRSTVRSNDWRSYFAWRPIEVGNKLSSAGTTVCWLEWLERKEAGAFEGAHVWSKWVYRYPVTVHR